MTKRYAIQALVMLVCTLGACASPGPEDNHHHGTMGEHDSSMSVDPVIARQRSLEAALADLGAEKSWGFKLGGAQEIHRCWSRGDMLLCEAYDHQDEMWIIHCIDLRRGKLRWILELGEHHLDRAPYVGRGTTAFLTADDGGLIVVDNMRGSRIGRIRSKLGIVPSSPATSDGATVYLGSQLSGRLTAVAGDDGVKAWDFLGEGTCNRAPVLTHGLAQELVIYGTDAARLYALPARSYSEGPPSEAEWVKPLNGSPSGDIVSVWMPGADGAPGEGLVIAPCDDGWLYGVDPATGRSRWIVRSNAAFVGRPAVRNGRVYATNRDRLFCVDAKTGKRLWYPASAKNKDAYQRDEIFGPAEGFELGDRLLADDGKRVFLFRRGGRVMRCKWDNGEVENEWSLDDFDFFPTNTATGELVVLTRDGYVLAFK